jgi:hypothetical protein
MVVSIHQFIAMITTFVQKMAVIATQVALIQRYLVTMTINVLMTGAVLRADVILPRMIAMTIMPAPLILVIPKKDAYILL